MANTKGSDLPTATLTEDDLVYIIDSLVSKKGTIAALRTAIIPKGFIPLDITALRTLSGDEVVNLAGHGGILGLDSVPILKRADTSTDKSFRVEWASGVVAEVQFPPVPMPMDLDEEVDVTIHLVAEMSGAADTPTIDIQVRDGIGDTEMGGVTGALADALAEVTVTIANADITGNPLGFFNIGLVPGAHGTDAIYLNVAWIEYTRKLAT